MAPVYDARPFSTVAVVSAVGLVVPAALLAIARPFLSPAGLYAAAGLRPALGTALFVTAPTSRAPQALRIVGVVIFVAGLVTPLLGVERARAIVEWWAAQGSPLMRVWAVVALAKRTWTKHGQFRMGTANSRGVGANLLHFGCGMMSRR